MRMISSPADVVRVMSLFLLAVAVTALAIAMEGFDVVSLLIGVMVVLAGGLAAIQTRRLVNRLHHHSKRLSKAARNAERHYVSVLRRIVKLVEARDRYCNGHSNRVGELAGKIARRMGMDSQTCSMMKLAGQLHDIGMLVVPTNVIAERSRIGVDEFRTVKSHSQIGYEVLRPLKSLEPILPAIRSHHERMNGTGYPTGLTGEDIPLTGRILAVADTFDAMSNDRPHRPGMSSRDVIGELNRCSPAGYDPNCVAALAGVYGFEELLDPKVQVDASTEAVAMA